MRMGPLQKQNIKFWLKFLFWFIVYGLVIYIWCPWL